LQDHPTAVAYGQAATAVVAFLSFVWASRYARRPKGQPPQRRITRAEDQVGAKIVCNPGRRASDRCAMCPLDQACLKNLPPATQDEALRDRAAALMLTERLATMKSPTSVLIVDDNAELCMVIEALLSNEGIRSRIAHTIEEALPIRENEGVLITDWRLEDGTGSQMIHEFRMAQHGKPVVVMSDLDQIPPDMPNYVVWVTKPFDADHFVNLVKQMVRG
jgi:CheY-like chemotaxis protein